MHGNFAVNASGCTPFGESLWWVLQRMQCLAEHRKIILILTDGDPDSFNVALESIEDAKRFGVEIYGLGIMSETITKLLPNQSRIINDLSELAPAIFGILRGALVK